MKTLDVKELFKEFQQGTFSKNVNERNNAIIAGQSLVKILNLKSYEVWSRTFSIFYDFAADNDEPDPLQWARTQMFMIAQKEPELEWFITQGVIENIHHEALEKGILQVWSSDSRGEKSYIVIDLDLASIPVEEILLFVQECLRNN